MNQYKTCFTCKQTKPVTEFGIHKVRSDGYDSYCLICKRLARKEYRQRQAQTIKIQQADNYRRNRTKRLAYAKAHPKSAELARKNSKQYRLKNKELMAAFQRARTAKKRGNGRYKITQKDMKRLYAQPCIYCGSKNRIEADHVIPIARGGVHGIGNLVPACYKCNRSRQDKFIMEWRIQKRKTP